MGKKEITIYFEDIADYEVEEGSHKYFDAKIPKFKYNFFKKILYKLGFKRNDPFKIVNDESNWKEIIIYNMTIYLKSGEKIIVYSPHNALMEIDKLGLLYEKMSKSNLYEDNQDYYKKRFDKMSNII
jgi:hypothetical protein